MLVGCRIVDVGVVGWCERDDNGTMSHKRVSQTLKHAYPQNVVLSGRVVRVSDGDTIRLRHTPIYPLIGACAWGRVMCL